MRGDGATDVARSVTPKSAKGVAAVYAAVSVLARSVASLPLKMYRRDGEDKSLVSPGEHPVATVLRRPGAMTSYALRDFLQRSRGLYGRGYVYINRTRSGVRELIPIHPDSIEIKRTAMGLVYRKGQREFRAADVLDIPWSTWIDEDGVPHGEGPVQCVRESIGAAIETSRHSSRFMGNAAIPAGVLTGPIGNNRETRDMIAESWQRTVGGGNRYKTAVLDSQWEWKPLTLPARDAQLIEQRQMDVEDIARIFNVPASMINDNRHSTFSNTEQQGLHYVIHSLMPHLVAIESEMNDKLFNEAERDEFFVQFNVDGLLRGDYESRMKGHALAIQHRILNPNEVRSIENRNRYEGGDEFRNPNIDTADDEPPTSDD